MQTYGRTKIYTNEPIIHKGNVIEVLQRAFSTHLKNASESNYLIDFEKGMQPLQRTKQTRTEVDIQDIDNVAHEIASFNMDYHWANPITFVQRGEVDTGIQTEPSAIALLNEQYSNCDIDMKRQELAPEIEICCEGYTLVSPNMNYDEENDESMFNIDVVSNQSAFVVYSSFYSDKRKMLGVTYMQDTDGVRKFTCYTDTTKYEIKNQKIINEKTKQSEDVWSHEGGSGVANLMGKIPLVKWIRSYDGMGCFERLTDEMNALNILESDYDNDVDQTVNSVWHGNDVEFPMDENGNIIKPKSNDWVLTKTTKDGKQPFINPLTTNLDYNGLQSRIENKRALILQKANVPRQDGTSGSGVAVSDSAGWSRAEIAASRQDEITKGCVLEEGDLVLRAIKINPNVPDEHPLKMLKKKDLKVSIKRQKSYEMTTKANFMATLINHGFYGEHVINAANLFDDPNQVWADSREMIEAIQKNLVQSNSSEINTESVNNFRLEGDNSDQVDNSPLLDSNRG